MPWYVYNEKGYKEDGPYKTRADAIAGLEHIQMYSTSHTRTWSVGYGEKDKNEVEPSAWDLPFICLFGPLYLVVKYPLKITFKFLWWMISKKKGRKFLVMFSVATAVFLLLKNNF